MTLQQETPIWLLDFDGNLMNETLVYLEDDYASSTMNDYNFWDRTEPFAEDAGRLVYKLRGNRLDRLDSYDFYPASASTPVVSDRMRRAVEQFCDPGEVAFHPCEIRVKSGAMRMAWNMYPLNTRTCVNREISSVEWKYSTQKPGISRIEYTDYLVFKPGCMGSLQIARLQELDAVILVSNALKNIMQSLNPKAMTFRRPDEGIRNLTKPSRGWISTKPTEFH